MNLKDRRVDKALHRHRLVGLKIFYSPIKSWVLFMTFLLIIVTPFYFVIWQYIALIAPFSIAYFGIGYLVAGKLNNSFAINPDKLVVVNPNSPWQSVVSYTLSEIHKIRIDEGNKNWMIQMLGILERNYLEIYVNNEVLRYYCSGLSIDFFDENLTKKTIDDLTEELKKLGVKVEYHLE